MADRDGAVQTAARRHGLSEGAVEVLWEALVRGRGQAQFSHPELGGMGQWSGGMLQIGDMFNAALKAKVAAACADIATQVGESRDEVVLATRTQRQWQVSGAPEASFGAGPYRTSVPRTGSATSVAGPELARAPETPEPWPGRYGAPASSGSQNGMRYAYFPDLHRLVVDRDGHVTIYDTGHHRLSGVSQQQSRERSLAFVSQHGTVGLDSLAEVDD